MTKLGKWKHFKGGSYEVLGTAIDSEDLSPIVLYRPLYNESKIWARREDNWHNPVKTENGEIPRFVFEGESGGEIVTVLFENEKIRTEKIVSNGHASPQDFWYEQNEDEYVLLENGEAVLQFESGEIALRAGGSVFIKAKKRHRVKSVSDDAVWICVFLKK